MSGKLHKIADELGVVARNLDGRFILMDVRSLDDRPRKISCGSSWILTIKMMKRPKWPFP